jgi:PAS domain S-box-containing protein
LSAENARTNNSIAIRNFLNDLDPILFKMSKACYQLMNNPQALVADSVVRIVERNELPFLLLMERTVATYQSEAEAKLARLKKMEWVLSVLTIATAFLGFVYIFLPSIGKLISLSKSLIQANSELVISEDKIGSNLRQIQLLQMKLEVSEKQYRSLVENSQDLITIFDMDGNYTFVSNSAKSILGYDSDELIGKFGIDFVHPEDREMLLSEPLKKVFEGKKILNPQFRLRRKDGSYIWIEAHSNPIINGSGKVVALETANRDITIRKEIEMELSTAKTLAENSALQLQELLADKNDLIGLFSHDMRSPINQIKGLNNVMSSFLNDPSVLKDCIDRVEEATSRLLSLYENILFMLRSDQISMESNLFEKVTLVSLVDKIAGNLDWELKSKNLNLSVNIPEYISINMHEQLFSQAIHNLISNSIKFSPTNKTIEITAKKDAGQIEIRISDEGIGFHPEKAERLFDRFTKEGRKGTNDEISTGLGLYLVRKIITSHEGTIIGESEGENKGSVFTIRINN